MAVVSERYKEKSQPDKLAKEKTLDAGSKLMPNVSRKRLLRSILKEKDPVARERLRACLHRKEGWSIRRICEIMVRHYSTVRDWLWRMQGGGFRCRHDKKRGR